jgi:hypothetical protein
MKKIITLIFWLLLTSVNLLLSAQEIKRPSIGFQLNPYMSESLFNGESITILYAMRYNIMLKDHITLGPEVSGNYFKMLKNEEEPYSSVLVNVGGYFRYSFLPKSRIRPYLELSPYLSIGIPFNRPENAVPPVKTDLWLSGYFAPGFSLYNKSQRFNFDLFYKVSNEPFANGKLSVLSYRLNFKF